MATPFETGIRIPADKLNDMAQVTDAVRSMSTSVGLRSRLRGDSLSLELDPPFAIPLNCTTAPVTNITTATATHGIALVMGDQTMSGLDALLAHGPAWEGDEPDFGSATKAQTAGRWCVTLDPIQQHDTRPAAIDGFVWCRIHLQVKTDKWVDLADGSTRPVSQCNCGYAEIIWSEVDGSGDPAVGDGKWAILRLGDAWARYQIIKNVGATTIPAEDPSAVEITGQSENGRILEVTRPTADSLPPNRVLITPGGAAIAQNEYGVIRIDHEQICAFDDTNGDPVTGQPVGTVAGSFELRALHWGFGALEDSWTDSNRSVDLIRVSPMEQGPLLVELTEDEGDTTTNKAAVKRVGYDGTLASTSYGTFYCLQA